MMGPIYGYFTPAELEESQREAAERASAKTLATPPAPAAVTEGASEPVKWTPGPNVFKDWCSQWFGPDSDDDYLAKAVFALPPMAQRFKTPAPHPAVAVPGSLTDEDAVRDALQQMVDAFSAFAWGSSDSKRDALNNAERALAATSTAAQPDSEVKP